jgi:hypothetical protein
MAEPGCSTEECTYTGSQTASDAMPGLCTGQAGYIANAEIYEIMANPSRIVSSYLDQGSDSNILVYDNNQWVGYMDEVTKAGRISTYQQLGFGGTTDWATDLAQYNEPPDGTRSWAVFKTAILNGVDPGTVNLITNEPWDSIPCSNPYAASLLHGTPSQKWTALQAESAWTDLINKWTNVDQPSGATFMESLADSTGLNEFLNCEEISNNAHCQVNEDCDLNNGVGAAAWLIYNSIAQLNNVRIIFPSLLGNLLI